MMVMSSLYHGELFKLSLCWSLATLYTMHLLCCTLLTSLYFFSIIKVRCVFKPASVPLLQATFWVISVLVSRPTKFIYLKHF